MTELNLLGKKLSFVTESGRRVAVLLESYQKLRKVLKVTSYKYEVRRLKTTSRVKNWLWLGASLTTVIFGTYN